MSAFHKRGIKHLGTLHGEGVLAIDKGAENLGLVTYEIDGFWDRGLRFADGQIEGDRGALERAFRAGTANITLAGGTAVAIVVADPEGDRAAEITIRGDVPF